MLALIAHDDPEHRVALRTELERHDLEVIETASAQEALSRSAGVELAVIAWQIGNDDGVELSRALRAGRSDGEVTVVVVGPEEQLDVHAALAAGATDVWPLRTGPRDGTGIRLALAGHYARLQTENVRLGGEFALMRQALDLSGTGFVLTDPHLEDNPIVYANDSFYSVTGYTPEETLGRNCRFLQGEGTEPAQVERVRRAVAEERPVTVELLNRRRDGTPFRNELHVAPVRDDRGRVVRFVGVQVDVTAYRRAEMLRGAERRARVDAEEAQRRSAFLADASLLGASLDLRVTLDALARLTVPHLGDLCLVDVVEAGEVRRVTSAATDPAAERALRALPARYVAAADDPIGRVLRHRRAEIVHGQASAIFGTEGLATADVALSAMLVPLVARGSALGVLALASTNPERTFEDEDLALAEDLAGRAALAIDNARLFEHQRHVARTLQESLLPSHLPEVEGLEFGAAFRPAGDGSEVGGDFYDVVALADGSVEVVVGDVAGKGANAAALTALTRHTVRTAATYEPEPSAALGALNRALVEERGLQGRYCTVAVCRLVAGHRGAVTATVCCAGHPLPHVLRADGAVVPVGRPGTLLGYVDEPTLHDERVTLAPGDALVLYTDGVTEARTPDGLLGDAGLASMLRGCEGLGAAAIAERLLRATVSVQPEPPRDDVAIVVARVAPRPAGSTAAATGAPAGR